MAGVVPSAAAVAAVCTYTAPDEAETQQILASLKIDRYDLDSALDPDEVSRLEFTPDYTAVIWKQPNKASFEENLRFDVSSVGLFLHQDRLTIITAEKFIPFLAREFQGISSPVDVLLRYFLYTIHHYLSHLKAIKQMTAELESKISSSMENRYLLQMFALSESLIYYLNAIESNGGVLARLIANVERLGFSKPQVELLNDIILENAQCTRQAEIYSTVLSGLMDARGSIINNNMNGLLKRLTLINVVFLPLNLIASIGGMSEFSMMTRGVPWWVAYLLFSLAMIGVGWLTLIVLNRYVENGRARAKRLKGG